MYCSIPPTPDVFRSLLVTNMWSLRWIILSSSISPLLQGSHAEQVYQSNGLIRDFTGIELMLRRPSILLAFVQTLFTWLFCLIVQGIWITMKGAVKFYLGFFYRREVIFVFYLTILQVCNCLASIVTLIGIYAIVSSAYCHMEVRQIVNIIQK